MQPLNNKFIIMKKLLSQGISLAKKIEATYEKLDIVNEDFFKRYHDIMMIQRDCAWEEVGELEVYSTNPDKIYGELKGKYHANGCITTLKDTLAYCNAVIKLQEQTKKIPQPIFG